VQAGFDGWASVMTQLGQTYDLQISSYEIVDERADMSEAEVLERMQRAMSAHDLEALVGCFAVDYHCEIPLHPSRSFTGQEHVHRNWSELFAHVPDLQARVVRSTRDGDEVWSEWEMTGTATGGSRYLARGVAILGVNGARITWARFYLDPVDGEPALSEAS
jgi:ketosteroid isomerase-like protein